VLFRSAPPPSIVLMSVQYRNAEQLQEPIARLTAAGHLVVVAAGDGLEDACTLMPSGAMGALAVAATTQDDRARDLSNWGSCIGLWAPGSEVASLALHGEKMAAMDGSSMAAAFVAGAAAAYLARHPTASPAEMRDALRREATPERVHIGRERFAEVTSRDLLFIPDNW